MFLNKINIPQARQLLYPTDLDICGIISSKIKIPLKRSDISKGQGNPRECVVAANSYPKKWDPEMFASMFTTLDNMCVASKLD